MGNATPKSGNLPPGSSTTSSPGKGHFTVSESEQHLPACPLDLFFTQMTILHRYF